MGSFIGKNHDFRHLSIDRIISNRIIMKTLVLSLIFGVAALSISAQHTIFLKKGEPIPDVQLQNIYADYIEYKKDTALYDLMIKDIYTIVMPDSTISFDADNNPVYKARKLTADDEPDIVVKDRPRTPVREPRPKPSAIDRDNDPGLGSKDHFVVVHVVPTAIMEPILTVKGGLELLFSPRMGFVMEGQFITGESVIPNPFYINGEKGYGTTAELRYYPYWRSKVFLFRGRAFIGAKGILRSTKVVSINGPDILNNRIGGSLKIGAQRVSKAGFMVEAYLEPGIVRMNQKLDFGSGTITENISKLEPIVPFGIKLGWAF